MYGHVTDYSPCYMQAFVLTSTSECLLHSSPPPRLEKEHTTNQSDFGHKEQPPSRYTLCVHRGTHSIQ